MDTVHLVKGMKWNSNFVLSQSVHVGTIVIVLWLLMYVIGAVKLGDVRMKIRDDTMIDPPNPQNRNLRLALVRLSNLIHLRIRRLLHRFLDFGGWSW